MAASGRRCVRCSTVLASDNNADTCRPCQSATDEGPSVPPEVPPGFWYEAALQEAFDEQHMGHVIRAYRKHPFHGPRGLPQHVVSDWAGFDQPQVSKIERGSPITDLRRLVFWARLLRIPQEHLWFKLPIEQRRAVDGSATAASDVAGTGEERCDGRSVRNVTSVHAGVVPVAAGRLARGRTIPQSLAVLLDGTSPTPVPQRVGAAEITQVREAAQRYESWDFAYGGGVVREGVVAQLRWSARLLDADCSPRLRGELFSAVGYLAHICAFMAFDDLAFADADRMWRLALACAEEVDDWALRATVLTAMARQKLWLGHLDDGLTLAELALVRADRLTAVQQAMLNATKARFHAAMGHRHAALTALDTADCLFADTATVDVPAWMSYYDEAEHAADTGYSFADLAAVGHPADPARARLADATDRHAEVAAFARSRALNLTKLATLIVAIGDPHEAGELGLAAVDLADGIRSRRLGVYLRDLLARARPHRDVAEIKMLEERLATSR